MKKNIIIISILVAMLLALLPISSVIGTNNLEQKEESSVLSPLFSVRSKSMIDGENSQITSNYIGKNKILNLFVEKSTLNYNLQRALSFIKNRPMVLDLFLDKIIDDPLIYDTLSNYDITESEIQSYINEVRNDHSIIVDNLHNVKDNLPLDTPLSLSFNGTNNSLGFLIVFIFVILPIVVSITLLLATITIVTCFNVSGCFEILLTGMIYAFYQGLQKPV